MNVNSTMVNIMQVPPFQEWRIWKTPNSMKSAYLRSKVDHLFPDFRIKNVLEWTTKQKVSSNLIEEAKSCQTISIMKDKLNSNEMTGYQFLEEIVFLYALVRLTCPETILETGVANGSSTCAILEALKKNQSGQLYSIDLVFKQSSDLKAQLEAAKLKIEDCTSIPDDKQPGWLIPDEWKEQWSFHEGDALVIMPQLLSSLNRINIFLHDSVHTLEHMLQEFKIAWPYLEPNGILLADDIFIRNHDALAAFSKSQGTSFSNYLEIGVILKR